jgi:hypothetical protein
MMTKAWTSGGKILLGSNKVILCTTCPCGTNFPTVSVTCDACTTMPQYFDVAFAGATDGAGSCGDCVSNLNGTHRLTYVSGCSWQRNDVFCGGDGISNHPWELLYDSGLDTWTLSISPISLTYTFSGAWSCLSAQVMDYDQGVTGCDSFPATVTVTPGPA